MSAGWLRRRAKESQVWDAVLHCTWGVWQEWIQLWGKHYLCGFLARTQKILHCVLLLLGGCLEYWLHSLHPPSWQVSFWEAGEEGREEWVPLPHPKQDRTPCQEPDPTPLPTWSSAAPQRGRNPQGQLHDHGFPTFQAASVLPHCGSNVRHPDERLTDSGTNAPHRIEYAAINRGGE